MHPDFQPPVLCLSVYHCFASGCLNRRRMYEAQIQASSFQVLGIERGAPKAAVNRVRKRGRMVLLSPSVTSLYDCVSLLALPALPQLPDILPPLFADLFFASCRCMLTLVCTAHISVVFRRPSFVWCLLSPFLSLASGIPPHEYFVASRQGLRAL